ncbi:hypothetical protein BH09PSE4_BH09PSE4_22230 [soil metagenome]
MSIERLTELTPRQRDILRLVKNNLKSKQIARTLGISPHTVDADMRHAIAVLGVASRDDAAELLAQNDAPEGAPYQRLIYQAPRLALNADSSALGPAVGSDTKPPWQVPFLRQGRRDNDLTPTQRLGWIGLLSVLILLAVANFFNALGMVHAMAVSIIS